MKLHILSDLHLEQAPFNFPLVNADVHILAGDIHEGQQGIDWLLTQPIKKPLIYVLGNHEYYGNHCIQLVHDLKAKTQGTNIHILENDWVAIDDVFFFGCTLWSDFALLNDPETAEEAFQQSAHMQDLKQIKIENNRLLTTHDIKTMHHQSCDWLREKLNQYQHERCVVITHHAPSQHSLGYHKKIHPIGASFASNLEPLIHEFNPAMWIHGHLHNPSYYDINHTSIICNPRGYPDKENEYFFPKCVREV